MTYYSRSPLSKSALSRSNGRLDAFRLLSFTLLCFIELFIYSESDSKLLPTLIVLITASALLYITLQFQPYYWRFVNRAFAAIHTIYFWSSICLVLTLFLTKRDGERFIDFLSFFHTPNTWLILEMHTPCNCFVKLFLIYFPSFINTLCYFSKFML